MNTYLDQEDLTRINRFNNAIDNTNMMGRPSSLTRQNIEQSKYNQPTEYFGRGIAEIVPLVDEDFKHSRDIGTNIKKGFIAAIGNAFGAPQPVTAMIAENVNMMQNNLSGFSYQNFDGPQQSSQFFQNQYDDLNCVQANSIQRASQHQQIGGFQQQRNALFEEQPFNCAFDTGMAVQEDVFKVPESVPAIQPIVQETVVNQVEKQEEVREEVLQTINFKTVEQSFSQEMINESSSTPSKNKRSLKAQTKKQAKKTESKQENLPLTKQSQSLPQMILNQDSFSDDQSMMSKNGMNPTDLELEKLTNKKKEYLQDAIIDKNGAYSYLDDPLEYKKARKRLQNRESAVRSRQRKKNYQEELEDEIAGKDQLIYELQQNNNSLTVSNKQLLSENTIVKDQLRYFQDSCADSILVGGESSFGQDIKTEKPEEKDYAQQLAELLKKINHRFQQDDQMHLDDLKAEKTLSGEKSEKRQRLDSGSQINVEDSSYTLETVSENQSCYKETQNRNNSSKGYLRMALVLGMMACSSINPDTKPLSAAQEVALDFPEDDIEQSFVKMNLIAQQTDSFNTNDSDKAMQQTAHMMKTFKKNMPTLVKESVDNSANLIKTLVNGKYSYLAKSMANTASFGFWITPNQHKLRNIKPRGRIIEKSMEF